MCRHLAEKHEANQSAGVPGGICTWNFAVPLRIVHATPITSVVCKLFTDTDVTDKSLCRMRLLMRVSWVTGYV
jgi:hypothetical protein